MSFAWENPEYMLTRADENLLHEAELAAARCANCGKFGHRWEGCPRWRAEYEQAHMRAKQYRVESWSWDNWLAGLWFAFGLIAGGMAALLWEGLTR